MWSNYALYAVFWRQDLYNGGTKGILDQNKREEEEDVPISISGDWLLLQLQFYLKEAYGSRHNVRAHNHPKQERRYNKRHSKSKQSQQTRNPNDNNKTKQLIETATSSRTERQRDPNHTATAINNRSNRNKDEEKEKKKRRLIPARKLNFHPRTKTRKDKTRQDKTQQ